MRANKPESCPCPARMSVAEVAGTNVHDSKYEVAIAKLTASASGAAVVVTDGRSGVRHRNFASRLSPRNLRQAPFARRTTSARRRAWRETISSRPTHSPAARS